MIKTSTNKKCLSWCEGKKKKHLSYTVAGKIKGVPPLWRRVRKFFKN